MSVQDSVTDFVENVSGPVSIQKIIDSTPGDYDEVALALDNLNRDIFLGNKELGRAGDPDVQQTLDAIEGAEIPSKVQKALGQDPSDTDIDDLDDGFKAFGPSNFSIGGVLDRFRSAPETPDNFEGPLPGPDPDNLRNNSNMNQELENGMNTAKTVKSVIENNTSLIIVSFFILGAIGVSLGPLDFE
jgi:hypothetical protein